MDVRVRVLGPFELEGIAAHRLGSRKARTLLKRLALARGRPVSVDQLVDCVWPDDVPSHPEQQLSVLVSRLRAVLGAERLPRGDAGYALQVDWLDLDQLARLAEEAVRQLGAGRVALARAAAEAALTLARGPLLADEPEADWLVAERVATERQVSALRHAAAQAALAGSDHAAAAELASAALEADPYDEAALRLLMRARAATGRPAAALTAYTEMRRRLDEDLGVDPAPETDAVHGAILRGEDPTDPVLVPRPWPAAAAPASERAGRHSSPPAPSPHLPVPGASRPPSGRPAPIVTGSPGLDELPGRREALGALDAALERAAAGNAALIVIEGEAGIGKSRLLETWARRAAATSTVLRAAGDELERSLPLQPIADALDGYLRTLPTTGAVLEALGPQHAVLAPLLTAAPPAPHVAADPIGGRSVLFAAILDVLARLAARRPVALTLDDLHLADRATLEWLHFAVRRGTGLRLLLVGAVRVEEDVGFPATERISLEPLDVAAVALVVGAERAAELHALSGGHPLFLVELVGAAGTGEGEALPASLREAVIQRCDRAGAPAANTLRTAALLGAEIDIDLLSTVVQLPRLDVLEHLEEGVRRRLIAEHEGGFVFRHNLVREALATGARTARRALIHREAGRILAARAGAEPLLVAYHARLGGDRSVAAAALTRAATRAAERYDHAEAERLLSLAIELDDSAPLRLHRSRTRVLCRDSVGAWADARAAFDQGAGAAALEAAGWAAYYTRDFPAAVRHADDGASLSAGEMRSACLVLGGRTRHATGDLTGAETRLEEAVRLAADPARRQAAAAWLAQLRGHQGRAHEALELAGPVARALHTPELQPATINAKGTVAAALGALGRAAEALAAVDELEREIERRGATRYNGRPANWRAWILRAVGDFAAADEANLQALDEARRAGNAEPQVHALLDLADGGLQRDDLDGAAARLAEAEPLQRGNHAYRWRHQWRDRLLRGRLALLQKEFETARRLAAGLEREAAAAGVRRYAGLAYLVGAEAAIALGEAVDRRRLEAVLSELPHCSGLEAWRLAASAAAATRVEAFWGLAERYASHLASQSGSREEAFRRYAGARLERMRMAGRQG